MLTERQKQILSAIVDDYIRSGEPIGSRSISKRGNVGFSPATIRNEMSDLEEMGFLEQPHTSAGRIPSNKGYRYYVDNLVHFHHTSDQDVDVLKHFFAEKIQEMEQVIQQVAMILSQLTNYTSIVLGPEVFNTTLKRLQFVPLDDRTAVAIVVTNTGQVENKTVTIPEGVQMAEIEKMVNLLNSRLVNVPLYQFKSKLYNEISQEMSRYVSGYEDLLNMMNSVLDNDEEHRVFLGGTTNMLIQPEFKDVEKVKTILDMLSQTQSLVKLFAEKPSGIQVCIGEENRNEAINDCSLITATYSVEGHTLGTIGILGPTRMEYARVIHLLDRFSKELAVVMGRWYK
ncbi:heat-inducible transcriptional repressor HrcA [Paenibacillus thalictri]|uniref:Heat-inducible transcription repressor HrcA n=1 Tax=Paenibacillus thalictri TaxID=2527873 RepID=A0A4Q9DJ22_9BACL|nr:heat-inducible transcriptional repressor HrcA [Paenibacillus thalictri]TBL70425.1 heat-inducible transcriptional repressor HrcA [Paenibacillus thalictri]